jgi:hypothetical protein
MSDAGTLLSDLDGAHPSDGDLVDSILSDLNEPSPGNPVVSSRGPSGQMTPPPGMRLPMQPQQQGLSSTYPNAADPAVPTAHMIGRDHPTEADFQRMMLASQEPLPFNSMAPQMQGSVPFNQGAPSANQVYDEPKKNWQGQWIDELKQPIFVAILVFIITLPAVNLLVSHYAPQFLRPGGDFTTAGMVARALFGGALFWILQRVIAPLLSI